MMADDETVPASLSPLLEAVRTPIPGENPCGRDVYNDSDYQAIKTEIDRLGTVSGQVDQERAAKLREMMDATRGTVRKSDRAEAEKLLEQRGSVVIAAGGPDYSVVIDRASRILSEKSKDIRVACYLCFALWQRQRFPGLAEGLSAIDIMVSEFWEGLYPSRTRLPARKAAVDFLTSKLSEGLEFAPVKGEDRGPLERAGTTLVSLEQRLAGKMPEGPPSFLGLTQAVQKCLARLPKPAREAVLTAPDNGAAAQVPNPGAAVDAGPLPSGEIRSVQEAGDLVRRAAKYLRQQNPRNPAPYRLARILRWDQLSALPPQENGRTKIEAPSAQRRAFLSGLSGGGDWARLLEECELSLLQPGFHLWLDMQHLTAAALDGLGEEFRGVRRAVLAELSLLVERLPGLAALAFLDGTPMADGATSEWIATAVQRAPGGTPGSPVAPPVPKEEEGLEKRIAEARKVMEGGDLAGALRLLQDGARLDITRRSAFRRELATAGLCLRGNQPAIARALLEGLEEEIHRHSLDAWEPALSLEVLTSLHRCYLALMAGPATPAKQSLQQLADRVFEHICRLDAGHALASTGARQKPSGGMGPPGDASASRSPVAPPGTEAEKGNGNAPASGSTTHSPA